MKNLTVTLVVSVLFFVSLSWGDDSTPEKMVEVSDILKIQGGLGGGDSLKAERVPEESPFASNSPPPMELGKSQLDSDAFAEPDSFFNQPFAELSKARRPPNIFDSSALTRSESLENSEFTRGLWNTNIEVMNDFRSWESISGDGLSLFQERKSKPMQINPLWYEEETPDQNPDSGALPWGWTLEPKVPKTPVKKGFLDW